MARNFRGARCISWMKIWMRGRSCCRRASRSRMRTRRKLWRNVFCARNIASIRMRCGLCWRGGTGSRGGACCSMRRKGWRENSVVRKIQAGGRAARVPEKRRGGNYSRRGVEGEAGAGGEDREAAACLFGSGPDGAGHSSGTHGGAAEVETISGHGAHGDFSDRGFFGDDWGSDGAIGDASAAAGRASAEERGNVSAAGVQDSGQEQDRGALQQRVAGEIEQHRSGATVRALSPGADAGARGFSFAAGGESADFGARAFVSVVDGLRRGGAEVRRGIGRDRAEI